MGVGQRLALLAGATVVATAASAQPAGQKVTGPVAVYWMSAATQSGFGIPGAGGGERPSMTSIMKMMAGGGGASHSLILQLGSSTKPTSPPQAEHLPPAGLGVGDSIPLVTPQVQPQVVHEEGDRPQIPREYQKPRGKMLIFWGCGEHAPANQPVVIDFAEMTPEKMAAGKIPPGLAQLGRGIGGRPMQGPSASRNATYGDWPNSQGRRQVTPTSSLVGDHTVRGDYSPDIKFSLDQTQDFLPALNLTTNARNPSGSIQLAWNSVAGAEAYGAMAIGASQAETVVLWSSSESQVAAFALPEYVSNGDLTRLVAAKTLMGPQTTTCTVPKEVADAAKAGFLQMVAYGREANFAYPARPANPKTPWNIQWEVKVRYRSATGGLLGQAMPGMGGGGGRTSARGQQDQPPPSPADAAAARRRAILNGIGGLIPH